MSCNNADNTDLSNEIAETAASPHSATVDGNSAQGQSLGDLIEADRYLKSQAASKRGPGIKFFKLIPPGATDIQSR